MRLWKIVPKPGNGWFLMPILFALIHFGELLAAGWACYDPSFC